MVSDLERPSPAVSCNLQTRASSEWTRKATICNFFVSEPGFTARAPELPELPSPDMGRQCREQCVIAACIDFPAQWSDTQPRALAPSHHRTICVPNRAAGKGNLNQTGRYRAMHFAVWEMLLLLLSTTQVYQAARYPDIPISLTPPPRPTLTMPPSMPPRPDRLPSGMLFQSQSSPSRTPPIAKNPCDCNLSATKRGEGKERAWITNLQHRAQMPGVHVLSFIAQLLMS